MLIITPKNQPIIPREVTQPEGSIDSPPQRYKRSLQAQLRPQSSHQLNSS